jgi:hypothetical protein
VISIEEYPIPYRNWEDRFDVMIYIHATPIETPITTLRERLIQYAKTGVIDLDNAPSDISDVVFEADVTLAVRYLYRV